MKFLKAYLRPAITTALVGGAFVSSWFFDPTALNSVSSELTALFGLMMAAVLPTMVLTATVLRAGNLSVKRINAYSTALKSQMNVWIGLFLISLASCVFLIVGKATGWSILIEVPNLLGHQPATKFNLAGILSALTWAGLALTVVRASAVGSGIKSLMQLSAEIALGEAKARDTQRSQAGKEAISTMPDNRPSASYVELKVS